MITKSHLATTAPTVALVLSFAVVFLLGRSLESVLPVAQSLSGDTATTSPASADPHPADSEGAEIEDLGDGHFSLGVVQRGSNFAASPFSPAVLDRNDGFLDACILLPGDYSLDDKLWEKKDSKTRWYCKKVPPGATVKFALEEQ
jgi:hypothetical protein